MCLGRKLRKQSKGADSILTKYERASRPSQFNRVTHFKYPGRFLRSIWLVLTPYPTKEWPHDLRQTEQNKTCDPKAWVILCPFIPTSINLVRRMQRNTVTERPHKATCIQFINL